ncbi:MAG TPA: diacylglycerol kinase family protein [Longimicrobium sp.]|nr:diacylglycerol kinase family protein [Longimicrobium sp.]
MQNEAETGSEPIPAFANPASGRGEQAVEAIQADARFVLRQAGPGELADAIRREHDAGARRVLVSGGDGTVATAAAAACETGIELAVLPGGTLNHFARDHGVPTDLAEALELAATGAAQPVDLGFVNDRPFLNTSSVGAYVGFVRRRDRLERWMGYRLASVLSGLRMMVRLHSFDVQLKVEGNVCSYRTALVFIGVGERETRFPTFGGRVENGRPGLHVIVVEGKAVARLTALGLAAAARGIDHVSERPHVDSFMADECTIVMPKRLAYLAIDGETLRIPAPFRYRIERGAMRVVLPDDGTAGRASG